MAALTKDRDTPIKGRVVHQFPVPQATNTVVFAGSIVCANATGWGAPGADTASFKVLGRAAAQSNNNPGANGAKNLIVESGVFKWNNNGNVTQAHVGTTVTLVDDNTVGLAADTTNDIIVGSVVQVESDGVWVATGIGEATIN
jgi:3D (Asp-Asp-Asp) domain-containing protein